MSLIAIVPAALAALLMLAEMSDIYFVSHAGVFTPDVACTGSAIPSTRVGIEGFGN